MSVSLPAFAQERVERVVRPARVQVDAIAVGPLIVMLLRDVMRVPYVIGPEVLADDRQVSVDLALPRAEIPTRVVGYIRSLGYNVTLEGGAVVVSSPDADRPSITGGVGSVAPSGAEYGSVEPLPPPVPSHLIAFPSHREVSELGDMLSSVLPEIEIAAREEVGVGEGRVARTLQPDALVVAGSVEQLERARQLLIALDTPVPVVEINALILEVRQGENEGSALSILVDLFDGQFQAGLNAGASVGDNYVRLAVGSLTAVLSATDGDGRFRVLARPSLAARSGSSATLNAGAQVPTIGSVSFAEDGTPVRSVVYRDSGIGLEIAPRVRGGLVELSVRQERSNFERTTTGVNDSPTLNRASSSSTILAQPGELIVLAGLTQESEENRRDGFFGGLFSARSRTRTESELLVVVQASISEVPTVEEIRFVELFNDAPEHSLED